MAFDFKKEYKEFYMPKNKPQIVTIPKANYIAVRGKGNPNEEGGEYKTAIGVLYAVAYTLKMSYKTDYKIEGFFEYVVPPLEGFWWQDNVESMLKTQKKELVESEMKELTAPYQNDKLEFIKNPVVAEFLGFSQNTDFTESDLEKSILSNLQKFLMELGKGYAFVARQQHIHTEKQDYYIDLVFYNYILKCFVLIDLKTEKITHQDVGQMDMYIRMYDELKRSEGDNPTIGIVLCSDTDDDIARYSVMHGNEQLFASKYKLYLPTKEELKAEIETQKAMFYLQQQDNEDRNKNYTFNIE